ncbi:MAG: cation:dicarboxylase symporter family transporter [Synergistaceae bacterium]|nr:cation:dicarboxylase symporter family transporter [Synergistaceae bacterium]
MLTADSKIILMLTGIIAAVASGLAVFIAVCCLYAGLAGKVNPLRFLSKYFSTMLAICTASSTAAIPNNFQACNELGISPKIYSFSVPLGATISLDASALCVAVCVLSLARMYGVEVSGTALLSMIASIVLLSVGTPGIPGASIVCISIILSQLGIPAEALGVIMGIDSILHVMRVPNNCLSCITTTLVVASRENLLDRNKFYGQPGAFA